MTEDEARNWLTTHFDVSRETFVRLEGFVALLLSEMEHQNLIAESTRPHVWARHIVDSAQLLRHLPQTQGPWIDLGSGAGLPAIVAAILSDRPVYMLESRRKRVEFLQAVIDTLHLDNAQVYLTKVERWNPPERAAVISARAYAPLPKLLETAWHLAAKKTRWLLPKGKNWQNELALADKLWQFTFHVEHSVTDAESAILILEDVRKRG